MLKKLIIILIIVSLPLSLIFGSKKLASYLLTQQLSSEKEVEKIINQENKNEDYITEAILNNQKVNYLIPKSEILSQISQVENLNENNILGTEANRWIEVDLSEQRLIAWEGNTQIYNFIVSTGKWTPTPTGRFRI